VIAYRHVDPRFPFLWEEPEQPAGRWHRDGEGPTHYLADTPDGAWAELLRHEEIRDPEDLETLRRALWSVEVGDMPSIRPDLPDAALLGGPGSWPRCQKEAERLRASGARGLLAPSAALRPAGASGWRVEGGLRPGPDRDGRVVVLFGPRPDLVGWQATAEGRPGEHVLERVRHFEEAP